MSLLQYKIYGSGKPLFILHGLFGSLDNWATLAKQYGQHFMTITVDLRNHGHSFWDDTFNYEVMAQDVFELFEHLEISKAYVMGHSMGGKTAMVLAGMYPANIEKLIVVDIAPKYYPKHHSQLIQAMQHLPLQTIKSRNEAEEYLKTEIPDFSTRQFLMKNLVRNTEGSFSWRINLTVIADQIEEVGKAQNHKYLGKTLFVRGEKSNYIIDDDFSMISGLFPMAFIETIPLAGHWIHADNPEAMYKLTSEFLKQ